MRVTAPAAIINPLGDPPVLILIAALLSQIVARYAAVAHTGDDATDRFNASPLADFRRIPAHVWLFSQIPWLLFILPLVAINSGIRADIIYIVVAGIIANEVWRMAGVVFSIGIRGEGAIIQWVRVVSTTLISGLVGRFIFDPPGALAEVDIIGRAGAFIAGIVLF